MHGTDASRREAELRAMRRALELAATPGVPIGPNPRVGCVLVADDGTTVAEGYHRGAGTAHAEADALARAGERARGTTAVVTLEPCNHTGRTGPCAEALLAAGIARVIVAVPEPTQQAGGGAQRLRDAGVDVELVVVPGMPHGADALAWVPSMTRFRASMTAALRRALG